MSTRINLAHNGLSKGPANCNMMNDTLDFKEWVY